MKLVVPALITLNLNLLDKFFFSILSLFALSPRRHLVEGPLLRRPIHAHPDQNHPHHHRAQPAAGRRHVAGGDKLATGGGCYAIHLGDDRLGMAHDLLHQGRALAHDFFVSHAAAVRLRAGPLRALDDAGLPGGRGGAWDLTAP